MCRYISPPVSASLCLSVCLTRRSFRMEVAALSLSLSLFLYFPVSSLDSSDARVSVSPDKSQFFKYDSFSVSCEHDEDEWTVMKRTDDGEVCPCPSPCFITAAFPATDSGVYWCQRDVRSSRVNVTITVTAGPVILESPVLPVTEGEDVTLSCRSSAVTSEARFYKDDVHVTSSCTRNFSIRHVSASHQGQYKCSVSGSESASSWLTVTAPPAGRHPPAPPLSVPPLLMVGTLYLLCTVLLGLVYRDRKRGERRLKPSDVTVQRANERGAPADDVIV
ncbi:low affinity immunoglobulin gamma Fc region receptor II-like [Paralichthys olivaceus]|uniref:low affinity immunoglobulin gamma Fc region receptor II-like n=1 Tax=Paralichthys olivaceus TaxID=8255 RepID=UPI00375195FB